MVLSVVRSARILKSGWLHCGQNEHRRELRDSMREDNEFGDVTLVHDSDTEEETRDSLFAVGSV